MRKLLSFLLALLCLLSTAHADTFIVTSNADNGPGTLRAAITLANANGVSIKDTILFNLPGTNTSDRTIAVLSPLPQLNSNIIIDASSQTGAAFGISSAKVIVSANLNPGDANDQFFYCLNIEGARDIDIYSIHFRCYANSYYFLGVAIRCSGSKNIRIGAPGKGNMFTGWLTGVGYPEGYIVPDVESDSIFIKSSIFGLLEDGNSTSYGISPWATIDACCRYSIFFKSVRNIEIGGPGADEGNIINYVGQAIVLKKDPATPAANFYRITNNRVGSDASGMVCKTTTYTNFDIIELSGTTGVEVINNHIMGESRIAGIFLSSAHNFKIKGNKINVDINGNQCNSDIYQGILIYFTVTGLIGGEQPGEENIIGYTSNNAGIFLFMTYKVTISRNSTYCNNIWGSIGLFGWYNDVTSGPEPFITVNTITSNSISGRAHPNSKIELFFDDSCSLCEGKIYITTLFANQNGDWSYTGSNVDRIVATATDTLGSTSEFTRGKIDWSVPPVIKHSTCGQNNGSITNIHILSGTSWYWEDSFGNVVSTDTTLTNVGPGRYRLVIIGGSIFCTNKTDYYEIRNIGPPVSLVPQINSAQCGIATGSIFSTYNTNDLMGVWTNEAGDTLGFGQGLNNLMPGIYYLNLYAIIDRACNQNYGPFVVTNQSGPFLNSGNMQITSATCNNSNGSIINIISTNATGIPFIAWIDSLNNIVGNTLDLLNQPAGKYKLKFKDQSGCDTIVTSFYIIPGLGKITIDTTGKIIKSAGCTINNGSIRNIKVTGADSYQWKNVSNNANAGNAVDIYNLSTGNYQLTATSALGCSATSPVINVPQSVFIPIGVTGSQTRIASCGENNGFTRITSFNNDSTLYSFRWLDSATSQQLATGTALYNIGAGTYLLLATDSNGCEKQITKSILGAYPKPTFDLSGMSIKNDKCARGEGSITGIKTTGFPPQIPLTYTWKNAGNNITGSSVDLLNSSAGQYYLTVSDGFCTVQSSPVTISNIIDNSITLLYDDQLIPRNTSTTLAIKNFQPGNYFLYSDTAGAQLIQQNTTGNFTTGPLTADADYYIRFVSGSCSSALTHVKITVVDKSFFAIASGFTPNNDGLNDKLYLKVIGYIDVAYFRIFSRNGEEVFSSKTINDGWNGKFKGSEQPSGVFVWLAKGKDINGKTITAKGTFVLIR